MASLRDLLFGAGVLKKAAEGPPAATAPAPPANPSGIDMAAEAQKAAARARVAQPAAAAPAAPPAAAPAKKKSTAATIGQQFMESQ